MNTDNNPENSLETLRIEFTGSPAAIDEVFGHVDAILAFGGVSVKINDEIEPKELTVEDFPDLNPDRFEVICVDGDYQPVITRNKLLEYSGIYSDKHHEKKSGDKGNGTRLWFLLQKVVNNRHRATSTDSAQALVYSALVTSEDGELQGIDPYELRSLMKGDITDLTGIAGKRAELLAELNKDLFSLR